MKTNQNFILRNIVGETVLVPTGTAAQSFNGLITMNEMAVFIWSNLDQVSNEEELLQRILEEYEIDEETARADVLNFLAFLQERGMVER